MATLKQFNDLGKQARNHRYFSDEFRRKKVEEIDKRLVTVTEVCREYQVSYTSVYKWIYKYSVMRKKQERLVLETESDTRKIKALEQKIKDLEQALGQKEIQLMFKDKMIEIAEDMYKVDIKKKLGSSH